MSDELVYDSHGCSVNIAICILILSLDPQGGAAGLSVELKDELT